MLFLALSFTQPYIPSPESGLQSHTVQLYLDNSNSLSNLTEHDNSGFNELLNVAQEIVNLYPQETTFNLLTNDFLPSHKTGQSKNKTLEALTEIDFSDLARNGKEVLSKMQVDNTSEVQDLFLLSDFQKSTIGTFESINDSLNQYHFVAVNTSEQKNISIDTVFLNNPFLIPNQKNSVQVKIKNQGPPVNDLSVKFFINDNQNATASIDIEENSSQTVNFELNGKLDRINKCLISFEDFPITFDNEYYFTLNQASQIKIVELSNDTKSPVSKVYKNNDLFRIESFRPELVSYPALERADLIVINGITIRENGLKAQIEKHLNEGKSTVVIPPALSGPSVLSIASVEIAKDSSLTSSPLAVPDLNNPFFRNIFESIRQDTKMPEVTPTHRWTINSIDLLKTKTGQPFLSHLYQKGNLYVFSGPFSTPKTNFHQHALFVPVMHRIAELSSGHSPSLAYDVDQTNLSLAVDSIPNGQLYKLKREDVELIPSQRLTANELVLDMPKYLLQPGFYDLMLGEHLVSTIAFNYSKNESDLDVLSVEELKANLNGIKHLNVYETQDSTSFSKIMKEKFHRRELWKYTLILSLLFLFAESVLLRFL